MRFRSYKNLLSIFFVVAWLCSPMSGKAQTDTTVFDAVSYTHLDVYTRQVHGWVFDIGTGKLIDLNIDFQKALADIMEIYKLE